MKRATMKTFLTMNMQTKTDMKGRASKSMRKGKIREMWTGMPKNRSTEQI